jgi:hypothetical protein
MNNLREYVDQMNRWNKLSNRPLMTFPLSQEDAQKIVYKLEGDLSPENLHCDGEITRAQAQRKYNYFMRVYAELKRHVDRVPELVV